MSPENLQKLNEVYEFMQQLKSSSSIPQDVDGAFRDRLQLGGKISSKTVASETQAVNEGGSASYNVPKLHDGYKQETINNTVIYLPYYT